MDSCVHGGRLWVWNSNLQLSYTGDGGNTYCITSATKTWARQIDRRFSGGGPNGKVAVTVEKNSLDSYWCTPRGCGAHRSRAVFYVP